MCEPRAEMITLPAAPIFRASCPPLWTSLLKVFRIGITKSCLQFRNIFLCEIPHDFDAKLKGGCAEGHCGTNLFLSKKSLCACRHTKPRGGVLFLQDNPARRSTCRPLQTDRFSWKIQLSKCPLRRLARHFSNYSCGLNGSTRNGRSGSAPAHQGI